MKSIMLWDTTPCGPLEVGGRFGRICVSIFRVKYDEQDTNVKSSGKPERPLLATCFHFGIFLGLFDPEDGGDIILRNARFNLKVLLLIEALKRIIAVLRLK
jgi:hypothetical protein